VPNSKNDKRRISWVSMNSWIWEFFFGVVSCNLIRPGAMWCVLALRKARAAELMKVCLELFMVFGNGRLGKGWRRIRREG
jgi:hypothetical protein